MTHPIIVSVPGMWKEQTELVLSVAEANQGAHLLAGSVLMETATRQGCAVHLAERDEALRGGYEVAGQGRLSPALLDAVGAHGSIAYLVLEDTGYDAACFATRCARALLKAGGMAVRVESAGVAHSPEQWIRLSESDDAFDIYSLFVMLVGGDDRYYSCGMHNFGLPDAAVPSALGVEDGGALLNFFNFYQLVENPVLRDGDTFGADAGSSRHRLTRESYLDGYDPDEPLYNPHGLWSLRPAEAPAPRRRRWELWG